MEGLMSGEKTGIATVVAEEFRPDAPVPGAAAVEQLALLPLSQVNDGQNDGNSVPAARGAGRPPGSKNKNTEAWRNFLLSKYQSPLIGLAEIYSRKVTDLAVELGFTNNLSRKATPEELMALLKLQIEAMVQIAPYIHQKQPMALDTGEGGLISLTIVNGNQAAIQAAQDVKTDYEIIDLQSEQNQGVIKEEFEKSND